MGWLLLTLLSAFCLASADAATKAWLQGYSAAELTLIRLALPGLLLAPLLIGLPNPFLLPLAFWGWLALSVPLEIAAMLLYMVAIRDHPLSLTLPYLAFTPAFALLIGQLFLGERVGLSGSIGVLLVVAGAWLLNVRHARLRDVRSWSRPFLAIVTAPGARIMLAVALIYAVTAVTSKAAMLYLPPMQFGAFYFALLAPLVLLLVLLPSPLSRADGAAADRHGTEADADADADPSPEDGNGHGPPPAVRHWRWHRLQTRLWRRPLAVLVVAALMALMIVTHFVAIAQIEAALMVAVKRLSLVFGILYGAWLFHEPGLATRLPAGLLMLAGVAMILIGPGLGPGPGP